MGIGDKFKDMAGKAKEKVSSDQANEAVEKGGDKLDEATGGKHKDKIDKGQETAKGQTERFDEP